MELEMQSGSVQLLFYWLTVLMMGAGSRVESCSGLPTAAWGSGSV